METRIYFHTIIIADLSNLQSAQSLPFKDALTSFRKSLFAILILLFVGFISISCKQNQDEAFDDEMDKQSNSNAYDPEQVELTFFNIDDKLLRFEDFENLVADDLQMYGLALDTINIYDNLFENGFYHKNAKVFFTNSSDYNPIRIYITNPENNLNRLSGQNLVGDKIISVFYISNFKCKNPDFYFSKDKVLVVLTKDDNRYYSNIIALQCGNRSCSYEVNNPKQNFSLDYLQNFSNYEDFINAYNSI